MGTHPIFESDFDCLTDLLEMYGGDNARVGYLRVIPNDENSVSTREQVNIKGETQIDIVTKTKRRRTIAKEGDGGLKMKGPLLLSWKSLERNAVSREIYGDIILVTINLRSMGARGFRRIQMT